MTQLPDEMALAMVDMDDDKVLSLVKQRLQSGVNPLDIVSKLQDGMVEVGQRFETGEFFLSELINCGEIMNDAMVILEPYLLGEGKEHRGNIVIATVEGDIHDLGKNIVIMLLKGAGYNVIDLGVDVPHQKIVEAVKENQAPLLCLSILLTSCLNALKETVDAVRDEGIDTKILVGGVIVDERVKNFSGADYGSSLANDAVKIAEKVFGQ